MKLRGNPEVLTGQKRILLSLTSNSEQIHCRMCKVKTNLAASSKTRRSLMPGQKAKRFTFLGHIN
jgi:hypothetical protein